MKKKIIYIVLVLLLVVGAVVAVKKKKDEISSLKAPSAEVVVSKVYEPKNGETKLYLEALSVVMSDNEINFSPRFGSLVEFVAPLSSSLKKGDLVVRLDDREIKADIQSAKSDLEAKKIAYENLKSSHERTMELLSVGGASLEQSQNEENALSASKAAIEASKARVASLQNALSYTALYAPFDGVVIQKLANVGDFAPVGKTVVTFGGMKGKYLLTKLPQNQNAISIEYNGANYPLFRTESSPDSMLSFVARPKKIQEGIGAKLSLKILCFDANATFLPSDSVLKREDGEYVLILESGVAKPKKVHILASGANGYATDTNLDGKKIMLAKPDMLLRAMFGANIKTVK